MTVKWTGFPAAVDLTDADTLVGLDASNLNARFNGASIMLVAQNLSDVGNKTTAFNNLSPLTTKGDLIWFDGTNNARLAIGSLNYILSVGASNTVAWVANPGLLKASNLSDLTSVSTALTNLGLSTGSSVVFGTVTATKFISTTDINTYSYANSLTAHAGGGQGSALALTKSINQIKTVATAGDSVKLPPAVAGWQVVVINAAAANSLDCFSSSGDQINALLPDDAFAIDANKVAMFFCAVNGTWESILTA